jgi:hypothetical protein
MGRSRLNPWPSVADLFSALAVVAIAALIFVTLNAVIVDDSRRVELKAAKDLADIFKREYKPGPEVQVTAHPCLDRDTEQCIEIPFRFVSSKSDVLGQGVTQVDDACRIYKQSVAKVLTQMNVTIRDTKLDTSNFVLVIEGHTDSRIPEDIRSGRERFVYNWNLSSSRAASVLYQFKQCGVSSETGYRIYSVGLADTRQLCNDPIPDVKCHEDNRRTTMRIRVERDNSYSGRARAQPAGDGDDD